MRTFTPEIRVPESLEDCVELLGERQCVEVLREKVLQSQAVSVAMAIFPERYPMQQHSASLSEKENQSVEEPTTSEV